MMLFSSTQIGAQQQRFQPAFSGEQINLRFLLGVIRYRRVPILVCAAICVFLALVYLAFRTPSYAAQTQLLVYNAKLANTREDAVFPESQVDPTFLETQMEILKSEKIALAVIDRLGLAAAQGKEEKGDGFRLGKLFGFAAPAAVGSENATDARNRSVLKSFQRNLSVERVGLSYVVALSFTAADPDLAARVANEVGKAYVEDQNAARFEAAQSASAWLRERIRDLGPRTRIIGAASRPLEKSNPGGLVVLSIALMAGLAFGVGAAFGREFLDRSIRTPEQASSAAGAECLAVVPAIRAAAKAPDRTPERRGNKHIRDDIAALAHVVDHPLSAVWHALRHVAVAIESDARGHGVRCLGVTSTLAREGKTTVAANLARLIASMGSGVLLIDANCQNGSLSRAFCPGERTGLIDLLEAGSPALGQNVWLDRRTGMHFLPIGGEADRYRRSQTIWSPALTRLLDNVGGAYEYVIFDLPPLASAGDMRAAAKFLDQFVLVMDWGRVTAEHVQVGLASAGSIQTKVLGTILNRVNLSALQRLASPIGTFLAQTEMDQPTNPISSPILREHPAPRLAKIGRDHP